MTVTQAIDFAHLDKYVCGDTALLDEILSIFVEQAEQWRARLTVDLDDDTWRFVCHSMKGAARGVGAWSLGDLAAEGEGMIGPDPDRAVRQAFIEALAAHVEAATRCALMKRDGLAA